MANENGQSDLTPAMIEHIIEKIREAQRLEFAEIVLEIRNGHLRFIRGPTPSEPIRR